MWANQLTIYKASEMHQVYNQLSTMDFGYGVTDGRDKLLCDELDRKLKELDADLRPHRLTGRERELAVVTEKKYYTRQRRERQRRKRNERNEFENEKQRDNEINYNVNQQTTTDRALGTNRERNNTRQQITGDSVLERENEGLSKQVNVNVKHNLHQQNTGSALEQGNERMRIETNKKRQQITGSVLERDTGTDGDKKLNRNGKEDDSDVVRSDVAGSDVGEHEQHDWKMEQDSTDDGKDWQYYIGSLEKMRRMQKRRMRRHEKQERQVAFNVDGSGADSNVENSGGVTNVEADEAGTQTEDMTEMDTDIGTEMLGAAYCDRGDNYLNVADETDEVVSQVAQRVDEIIDDAETMLALDELQEKLGKAIRMKIEAEKEIGNKTIADEMADKEIGNKTIGDGMYVDGRFEDGVEVTDGVRPVEEVDLADGTVEDADKDTDGKVEDVGIEVEDTDDDVEDSNDEIEDIDDKVGYVEFEDGVGGVIQIDSDYGSDSDGLECGIGVDEKQLSKEANVLYDPGDVGGSDMVAHSLSGLDGVKHPQIFHWGADVGTSQ